MNDICKKFSITDKDTSTCQKDFHINFSLFIPAGSLHLGWFVSLFVHGVKWKVLSSESNTM
jgi:hypothetical protein